MPAHEIGTREEWKAALDAVHEREQELGKLDEEIAKLRDEAQEWLQEVRADTERVWSERRELVDDLRALATRLQEAVSDIHARSKDAPSARDSRHTRG